MTAGPVPRPLTPAEQLTRDQAREFRRIAPTLQASREYVGTDDDRVALAMMLGEARQLLLEQDAIIARLTEGGDGHA